MKLPSFISCASSAGALLAASHVAAQPPPPAPAPSTTAAPPGTAPPATGTSEPQPAPPPADSAVVDLTENTIVDAPPPVGPPPPAAVAQPPSWPTEEEDEEPSYRHGGQRNLGFGPRIGLFSGFGAAARSGSAYVGTDISGGWRPVGTTLLYPDESEETENFHAWQLNGQAYVSFNPYSRFASGLMAGYAYNSILRHGASLAYDAVLNFNAHLGMQLTAGFVVFPDQEDQLRERAGASNDTEITGSWLDLLGGLQIGLMIYP